MKSGYYMVIEKVQDEKVASECHWFDLGLLQKMGDEELGRAVRQIITDTENRFYCGEGILDPRRSRVHLDEEVQR